MRIRDYISYSQYSCYKKSKYDYINAYLKGIRQESIYLSFGSKIATGLEFRNEKSEDKDILKARELIPLAKIPEKEIKVVWGGIPLLAKMDGFDDEQFIIDEYKTGKNPWTQAKVDSAEQLMFYLIAVSQFYKIEPEKIRIRLHWIETFVQANQYGGEVHLTGQYKVFETKRTNLDVVKFFPELQKVWIGIEETINEYIK
jgi:hypothetical protein